VLSEYSWNDWIWNLEPDRILTLGSILVGLSKIVLLSNETPNRQKPLVFEPYGLSCHGFIAASAKPKLIELAEACHSCRELTVDQQ
jgi:hypothetical protein